MWAAKLLGEYHGVLQVDGYEAYGQFGKPDRPGGPSVLAYCWAHARRGFFDAAKDDGAAIAQEALRRIGALYDIERELHGHPPDERLSARQARSRPIAEDLRQWLDEKRRRMFSGSPTLKAINYTLNHWTGLCRFLDDGRIDLDNNAVERSMRPVALQRKCAVRRSRARRRELGGDRVAGRDVQAARHQSERLSRRCPRPGRHAWRR